MQIKIFNIPIGAEDGQTDELNHFLRANKIIDIRKELANLDGNSCWTFCITYMLSNKPMEQDTSRHGGGKVDYKEILEPDVFEKFSNLRKLRKQIADNDAVPAYAVFTDAELSEMAKLPELSLEAMQKIPGIGKKKIEKYGMAIINNNRAIEDETGGLPYGKDSKS